MDSPHPIRRACKIASLVVIVLVGLWVLWPPQEETAAGEEGDTGGTAEHRAAKYVLTFSPGASYLPGSTPYGIGDPLKGVSEVIADFEKRFPDTKIDVITVPGVREYLVTQLSSGSAPDIINVNVEDVWIDVQKGWYVPLDPYLEAPNPFVLEQGGTDQPGSQQWWDMFKYQAISRGKAAPDNRNYCLTFDMIETGIFYNKDIFREVGVEPPKTWDDFLVVLAKLQEAGHIPLAMNLSAFNDWCVDLFFDQLYYSLLPGIDLVQDPTREKYLEGYLDWDELCFLHEKGFFTRKDPRYVEMWKLMRAFRKYVVRNLSTTDLTREFVTQDCAMLWSGTWMVYRLRGDKMLGFDWGVFYLPRFTEETTRFASNTDMCVIGGAGTQLEVTNHAFCDTGDPATSERLKRTIAFLQFLCMPENYARIVNEYPCLMPNVLGVPVLPSLEPFERILERRYTTTKWVFTFDLKFSEIQQRMLELYLNDGIDLEGFMDWQEGNLDAACANLLNRKNLDMERLQRKWDELAPVRAGMEGLPDGA